MNTIKRFLIKTFLKMDKLQLLLLVAAHYRSYELKDPKDIERNDAVIDEIDFMVDNLREDFDVKKLEPVKVEPKKDAPKTEPKKEETKKDAPKKSEIPEESLVLVRPYYDCGIVLKKGTEPKTIKYEGKGAVLELPAFVDEAIAKQFNNVYPTVDELELVLDEAWDMATIGTPNKDINEMLAKELSSYYAKNGLARDDDYYKISNVYSKLTRIMRRAFGESYEDLNVSVTRPSYTLFEDSNGKIVMTKEMDCGTVKAVAKEKPTPLPEKSDTSKKETPKTEEKAEMKTVQTQKTKETPKEEIPEPEETPASEEIPKDEEAQENEEPEENKEEVKSEDPGSAPAVNEFDSFNDIEKLVFDTLKAGNIKASKESDPAVQKTLKNEAREDAKLRIQSCFESEDWAQKDEQGRWSTEFLKYWNAIIKEIGTRANVGK